MDGDTPLRSGWSCIRHILIPLLVLSAAGGCEASLPSGPSTLQLAARLETSAAIDDAVRCELGEPVGCADLLAACQAQSSGDESCKNSRPLEAHRQNVRAMALEAVIDAGGSTEAQVSEGHGS